MIEETIVLSKYDEINFKLNGSPAQIMELKEYLSCYAKGYKFHPKFKAKIWDGKISYFHPVMRLLPIGMLTLFIEFCELHNYEFEFDFDINEFYSSITEEELDIYLEELFRNSKKKPRYFQKEAIFNALTEKRGLLLSATGTGKSLIIYSLIKLFTDLGKKVLLIVPNTGLVEQMFDDFSEYGWHNINDQVEMLYSGMKPTYKKNVLISTWQSIPTKKKDPRFYQEYDCVIVDEVHNAKALQLQKILKECTNAEYRIGTTATLPKDQSETYNIFSVIGTPIFEYKTKQGIEDGYLSNMAIIALILKYPKDFIEKNKNRSYDMEIDEIENYAPRNATFNYILNRIDPKDNIILLCRHIDHLEKIKAHLEATSNREIEVVHGKVKVKERERIRKSVAEREGLIILATYETMSTGVNINKIHHVIFGSPYKAPTKVLQAIGRGLRLHESKDILLVWDLADDMRRTKRTGSTAENYCWEHYKERMASYIEEGHEIVEEDFILPDDTNKYSQFIC
jgi:superfamily II DNA or RNA helicase